MNIDAELTEIFHRVYENFCDEFPESHLPPFTMDLPLLGSKSSLESMDFVSLVVQFESELSERFSRPIRLMDDRAMSETKSPFKTASTLIEFARRVIAESDASDLS